MDFASPHLNFVIAAYAISAAVIVGLVVAVFVRDRRIHRETKRFETERKKIRE